MWNDTNKSVFQRRFLPSSGAFHDLEIIYNPADTLENFQRMMVKYSQCYVEIHEEHYNNFLRNSPTKNIKAIIFKATSEILIRE